LRPLISSVFYLLWKIGSSQRFFQLLVGILATRDRALNFASNHSIPLVHKPAKVFAQTAWRWCVVEPAVVRAVSWVIQLFCSIVVSVVDTENCILQAFAKSSQDKFREERFWLQLKKIIPKQISIINCVMSFTIKAKNLSMKPSLGYSHKPTSIYWANCHL